MYCYYGPKEKYMEIMISESESLIYITEMSFSAETGRKSSSESRPNTSRTGSQKSRPQSKMVDAVTRKKRETKEHMEQTASELLAHFSHRNLESLLKVIRNTLEQLRKRITSSTMTPYVGGELEKFIFYKCF